MNKEYILQYIRSITTVFDRMVGVQVQPQAPSIRVAEIPPHTVSAVIGMSGDVIGSVVLSMPVETATGIVGAFMGIDGSELEIEEISDAVGELVNMIAGSAKAEFKDKVISISTPTIVVGDCFKVYTPRNVPIVEIPCDSEMGPFTVDVVIKEEGN